MDTIEQPLTQLLSAYPELKLAILFGSQAAGRAGPESVIDLALLADNPLTSRRKLQMIEDIGAEFGCPVDIIDLYWAAEPVLDQLRKGKRLFGSNDSYAKLLTKHLLDSADFLPLQQGILAERRASRFS